MKIEAGDVDADAMARGAPLACAGLAAFGKLGRGWSMKGAAVLRRPRLDVTEIAGSGPDRLVLLRVSGTLDATTYRHLRDTIIKTALSTPRALIVDVDAMNVDTPSALAAFTSARWHVSQWPDVAIVVVAADDGLRRTFARMSVSRYVPVYATAEAASAAVSSRLCRYRRRAVATLATAPVASATAFADEVLRDWAMTDRRLAVLTVAGELVENAVAHAFGGCSIRLETDGDAVTVAVSDDNPVPAMRRERDVADGHVSGLDVVAALSRTWHNSPTGDGKTVWALIGPENDARGLIDLLGECCQ